MSRQTPTCLSVRSAKRTLRRRMNKTKPRHSLTMSTPKFVFQTFEFLRFASDALEIRQSSSHNVHLPHYASRTISEHGKPPAMKQPDGIHDHRGSHKAKLATNTNLHRSRMCTLNVYYIQTIPLRFQQHP